MNDDSAESNDLRDSSLPNSFAQQLPVKRIESLQAYDPRHDSAHERSFKDYVRILFRYWYLVLGLAILGVGFSKYKTDRTPRLYRGTAMVNIGTYVPPVEGPTGDLLKEETQRANYVNTQTQLLKSYTLASIVLADNPKIRGVLEGGRKSAPVAAQDALARPPIPAYLLSAYLDQVTFDALDGTTLVRIHATTTDPELAAEMANAHAQGFIKLVQEQRQQAANVNLQFLEERYREATTELEDAQKKLVEHAEKNELTASGSQILEQTFQDKFRDLVGNLNQAILDKVGSQTSYREAKRLSREQVDTGDLGIQLARLEHQYAEIRRVIKNRYHPAVLELARQIRSTKAAIKEAGRAKLSEAEGKYNAATEREQFLRGEFENLQKEEIESSKQKIGYDTLQQQVTSAKEVQRAIAKRLEDSTLNIRSDQETVSIVDRAFPDYRHVSPNEIANLWRGLFLGLLLGIVLALFLDFWDNRVHSVVDLQQVVKVPVLGIVPEFSKDLVRRGTEALKRGGLGKGDNEQGDPLTGDPIDLEGDETGIFVNYDNPMPLVSAPNSEASESYRSILATLTSARPLGMLKSILITSGQQGDGKTTLALNTAICLAQMSEKTLLIDADLRLSSVYKYFNLRRDTPGLVDALTGAVPASEFVIGSGIENLNLLLAGALTSNPAALLRSKRMQEILEQFCNEYDYVILDSPPVGPVADPLILSRYAHGTVVVVRSGETAKPVAESAVARLRQVGADVLGIVLNDTSKSERYWKAGYGTYYRPYGGYYTQG